MGQGGASWRPSSLRFGERRALGGVVLPPFLGDGGGGQAAGLEAREEPGSGGQTVEAVMTRADFLLVQALAMSPLSRLLAPWRRFKPRSRHNFPFFIAPIKTTECVCVKPLKAEGILPVVTARPAGAVEVTMSPLARGVSRSSEVVQPLEAEGGEWPQQTRAMVT